MSVLEGIRLGNGIVPCGHNFDPTGSSLTWHIRHTRVHRTLQVWNLYDSPIRKKCPAHVVFFRKNENFEILTPLIFGPP